MWRALCAVAAFFAGLGVLAAPLSTAADQTGAVLYAPLIASPNATLTGTTGPDGSVTVDFEQHGAPQRLTLQADANGRFTMRAPLGTTELRFSSAMQTARCLISTARDAIAGGLLPVRAARGALAIVAGQNGYDVAQPLLLQVEHFDPLRGALLIDGKAGAAVIRASSDRSIVATISNELALGRHTVGVSIGTLSVSVPAVFVRTKISVTGPDDYRLPRTVTLGVDGLGNSRASVTFDAGNNAVLANDQETITVPVADGQADTTVKAKGPGQVNLRWQLHVDLDYKLSYGDENPKPHAPEPTPLVPCKAFLDDGWFEAVQGPYQDDPIFEDKPDHLVREAGTQISYYGQLSMVKDRPTLMTGVNKYYKNGTPVTVNSRNDIVMTGQTDCSEWEGAKIQFTLYEHGTAPRIFYTSPVTGLVAIRGNREKHLYRWTVRLSAYSGVPDSPFTLHVGADHFAIKAELVDEHNRALGFSMWYNGYTEVTQGPLIRLLPVILSHSASRTSVQDRSDHLTTESKRLQEELYENIPDLYPLAPHGLPMPQVGEPIDLTGQVLDTKWSDAINYDIMIANRHEQNLQAALDDRFATTTVLQGVGRTVAVMTDGDFDKLFLPGALGYTLSTKLVAVKWSQPWDTPGHEIAHTLPEFIWSSPSMLAQCGKDYHNKSNLIVYGLQTMKLSKPISGEHHDGFPMELMEGGSNEQPFISQCTYANLIDALRGPVDPQVLLVRFYLARPVHGAAVGKLRPAYASQATLTPDDKNGQFALTAFDRSGAQLERIRFNPPWADENGVNRNIISVQIRLRYHAGVAKLELRGPSGALLDTMTANPAPPVVSNVSASYGRPASAHVLHVSWRGGAGALYSVFLSTDRRVWYEAAFEQTQTSADIPLLTRGFRPHFVKVIATQGANSSQAVARF